MHRHFCASLVIIYLFSSNILLALAGKPETVQEVRLYHQAKTTFDIELFVFNNETDDDNYNYLSTTIPELIATQIELNKTILVTPDNLLATPVGYSSAYDYKILTYTNTKIITNYDGSTLTITTNNEYITTTNSITKKNNVNIIDAYSLPLTIYSNEELYMYEGEAVILKDNNDFKRTINVSKNFQKYNGENIADYAFTRNADIVIYGNIKKTRYTILITVYIAEIYAQTITSYSMEINEFELEQITPIFAIEIANQMNRIEKTGIINIQSEQDDALLYLDGIYIGQMPKDGIKIPSLTVGEHRITVEKKDYETIDKVFSFDNPKEDINLKFNLLPLTNVGKITINVPGGTNTTVIFNGLTEPKSDTIEKNVGEGQYSLKMLNDEYEDYYASIVLGDRGHYDITPNMKKIPEQTLARQIFGNYERNTKIGIGLSIAAGLFTIGSVIYANEIYDKTVMEHVAQYGSASSTVALNLDKYNTAYNLYIAGLVTTSVFTLATGIFYLLWISETNFDVEDIYLNGNWLAKNDDDGLNLNVAIHDGATLYFSKRF